MVSSHLLDIRNTLPFEDATFDVVLDSYCLCHFIDLEEHSQILRECRRVLRPGGHFVSIQLSESDVYYRDRIESSLHYGHVSFDPCNEIRKLHFSPDSYLEVVPDGFMSYRPFVTNFWDQVNGFRYRRDVLGSVLTSV